MFIHSIGSTCDRQSIETPSRKVEETAPDAAAKNSQRQNSLAAVLESAQLGTDVKNASDRNQSKANTRSNGNGSADGQTANAQAAHELTRQLSQDELQLVDELKRRDREVRAHEAAHVAVAGSLARSGAKFQYEQGPDGKNYAVGGDVAIDSGRGQSPEETLVKAQRVRSAALAPSQPSAQDRRVATEATASVQQAHEEMTLQQADENVSPPASDTSGNKPDAVKTKTANPVTESENSQLARQREQVEKAYSAHVGELVPSEPLLNVQT